MAALEGPQRVGKGAHQRRDQGPDDYRAAQIVTRRLRPQLMPAFDQFLDRFDALAPLRIEYDGACAAVKERHTQRLLQGAHL